MSFKKLLLRQLNHTGCEINKVPENILKWHEFLERINRTYNEADQERYLLDRSMQISSREMKELNEKLETAQQIARLGYWYHDIKTGENNWSKELYDMFELKYGNPAPNLEEILDLAHEEDRAKLKALIDQALSEGKEYEIEVRFKIFSKKNTYRWFHIIGRPFIKNNDEIHQLAGIAMDITKRKQFEEEVNSLNQQLVNSARRAGMADVATSILHNVGNILNSVNVSIGILQENINNTYWKKLQAVEVMMSAHVSNLNEYLSTDDQGKIIPQYLIQLINKLNENALNLGHEIDNLKEHIEHIKQITEMQKSLSGLSGITEKTDVAELVDLAVRMCIEEFKKHHIVLSKKIDGKIIIETDKAKALQILINLIQNAKDALLEKSNGSEKKLTIIAKKDLSSNAINISVHDNGIGIDPDNITKIYSFGFTTKKSGHGFGLHTCALIAKELGGVLDVHSQGINKGATFTLTLPIQFQGRKLHEPKQQFENHRY